MRTESTEETSLADQVGEIAAARGRGEALPAGRLLGLPELGDGDVWVDMAGAVVVTGAEQRTISAWLARGKPVANPFPAPVRLLYRLYWPLSTLDAWVDANRALQAP